MKEKALSFLWEHHLLPTALGPYAMVPPVMAGVSAMTSVLWLLGYSVLSCFDIFFFGPEGEKSPSLTRGSSKFLVGIYIWHNRK